VVAVAVRGRSTLLVGPALVAGGTVLAVTAAVVAGHQGVSLVPPCPLHTLTGLWCPLCGGTRAVQALVAGDLGAAVQMNLLVVLGVPVVVALWVRWTALRAAGRPASFGTLSSRGTALVAVALVTFMLVRNLPGLEALTP
jgi:hypothetical protein